MTDSSPPISNFSSGHLSVAEFCRWSGLSKTSAYKIIKQGDLRPRKFGRRTLITMEEAQRWWNSLPTMRSEPEDQAEGGTNAVIELHGRAPEHATPSLVPSTLARR